MLTKWYYRMPVKALALLLLFIFLAGTCLGLCGTILCGQSGFYTEDSPSFAGSGLVWQAVRSYQIPLERLLDMRTSDGSLTLDDQNYLEQMQSRFSPENSNLRIMLQCRESNDLLPLEYLLDMPRQPEIDAAYQLIASDACTVYVTGGIIGDWINLPELVDGVPEWEEYLYGTGSYTRKDYADESASDIPFPYPCTVTIYYYLNTNLPVHDEFRAAYSDFINLHDFAYPSLALLIVSLLLSFMVWIYLMCVVGHRVNTDREVITLRFIDRIPYDFFIGILGTVLIMLGAAASELLHFHLDTAFGWVLIVGCLTGSIILFIMLTLSTAVRWKSHTLLRNTLIWRICSWFWRGLVNGAGAVGRHFQPKERSPEELAQKQEQRAQTMNRLGESARTTAGALGGLFGIVGGWLSSGWKKLTNSFAILPMVWKGVLLLAAVGLINVFLFILVIDTYNSMFFILLMMLFDMWILWKYLDILREMFWLHEGAKRIASGDLDYQLPTEMMKWEFKAHGEALNTIRSGIDAAVEERVKAVEERIKSDRMRSELLTNVSHDIKTPLTSIINYVGLLKKEEVPGEKAREYIDVLDRQSIRLKKLLEDLLEASKASTGNITVNAAPTNVGELLRQVVGEYTEKLADAQLEPIITLPSENATIYADGRLLWRVFDNLMANIVKYAMPQTRVYLDLRSDAKMTAAAVKNVSRDRLNIPADELMERFVRGDTSRATEGSGLGLSIAQSLTELMGGTFSLMIDGDLFKVEVRFPTFHNVGKPETPAHEPDEFAAFTEKPDTSAFPADEPTPAAHTPEPAADEPAPAVPASEPAADESTPAAPAPEPAADEPAPAAPAPELTADEADSTEGSSSSEPSEPAPAKDESEFMEIETDSTENNENTELTAESTEQNS